MLSKLLLLVLYLLNISVDLAEMTIHHCLVKGLVSINGIHVTLESIPPSGTFDWVVILNNSEVFVGGYITTVIERFHLHSFDW